MANNLIPLQSFANRPRLGFEDVRARQLSLMSLERKDRAEQLALQQQEKQIQDQQKVKQVLSAGLPDDQAIQQLKMLGLHDVATAYEKSVADRNQAIAKMSQEQRLAHKAEIEQDSQDANAILQAPPERQPQLWDSLGTGKPFPGSDQLKFIVAHGMSVLQQIDKTTKEEVAQQARTQAPFELQSKIAAAQKAQQEVAGTVPIQPAQQAQMAATAETQARAQALTEQQRIETERHNRAMEAAARVRAASQGAGTTATEDYKDIADGIIGGNLPPDLTGMYTRKVPIEAELQRRGFNLQRATSDWKAIQKYLGTLNGAQQTRLRQAVEFAADTLPQLEDAYDRWKNAAGVRGMKIFNKAALATSKQFGGEASSAATQLEALIKDYTAELGTVYKGGNSSTDESLKLAGENLKADWNEQTFKDAIKRIRQSIAIRRNSIANAPAAGVTPGSPYQPPVTPSVPAGGNRPPLSSFERK